MSSRHILLIDWGTTNLRGYVLDELLDEVDFISSSKGIMSVEKGEFKEVLLCEFKTLFDTYNIDTILMSGMVGSKNGWVQAPYVECEVGFDDIYENLIKVDDMGDIDTYIAPGVMTNRGYFKDVMRGEEVQVFGAVLSNGLKDATFIIPGTHSKWISVKNYGIVDFKTNLTGEVFDVLSNHTILGKSIKYNNYNENDFIRGLECCKNGNGLLNDIFSTRTLYLDSKLNSAYSYLSAIIIAHEIVCMRDVFKDSFIYIIGGDKLNRLYETALTYFGIKSNSIPSKDATLTSLKHLYKLIENSVY